MPVRLALRSIRESFSSKQGSVDVLAGLSFDITPKALTVAMDTHIAPGNLKQQPKYSNFIVQNFIHQALAAT